MVEFGSGASTIRFPLARPLLSILSIEHDDDYGARTAALIDQFELAPRARVTLRPLSWQITPNGLFFTYAPGPLPRQIDLVLIDGPPGSIPLGREACLYQVLPHLSSDAVVVLDDLHRPQEKAILRHWSDLYGISSVIEIRQGTKPFALVRGIDRSSVSRGARARSWVRSLRNSVRVMRHLSGRMR